MFRQDVDENFSMSFFWDGFNDDLLSFHQFFVNAISYVVERGKDIVKTTLGRNRILPAVDLFFIGVFFPGMQSMGIIKLMTGGFCIACNRNLS